LDSLVLELRRARPHGAFVLKNMRNLFDWLKLAHGLGYKCVHDSILFDILDVGGSAELVQGGLIEFS
jgi:hypothetical protein